jgi:hypothetical protein
VNELFNNAVEKLPFFLLQHVRTEDEIYLLIRDWGLTGGVPEYVFQQHKSISKKKTWFV